MVSPSKVWWRARARAARAGLTIDHARHCEVIADFLVTLDRGPGDHVLGYAAMEGEVDLGPVLARSDLGPFALTRTPDGGGPLTIHPLGGPVERHRYGFDQPVADAPVVADDRIVAVLVPGLAFDRTGARLGHGAGYYDRLLGRLGPDVVRIGVTAGYLVAELPTEGHDVAMTHLAGPFGVLPTPLADPDG